MVTPIAATAPAPASAAPAGPEDTDAAGAVAEADFTTFLTLLTTQIRNQDPLEPMDSTQFVAQLASFSAVEQQIQANRRLEEIHAALTGDLGARLGDWLGKEVLAPASARFDGAPVEVRAAAAADADAAVLVVRDAAGAVVARRAVDPTAAAHVWGGDADAGAPAPAGLYAFALESYAGGRLIDSRAGEVFVAVAEARAEDGAAVLLLEDGSRLAAAEVRAVRAAS